MYGPAHANKNFLNPAGASLGGLRYGLVVPTERWFVANGRDVNAEGVNAY